MFMKRFIALAAEALAVIVIVVALLEVALRVSPALIPLSLLTNFRPDLREDIAARRGLPSAFSTVPFERRDGGPPFRVYKPGAVITLPFDQDDRDAVRSVTLDANGFCNPPEAAASEHVDVIALGDSFTWCVGVLPGDVWPQRFAAKSGRTVYSLGLGGIGPYEEIELLRRFGLERAPEIVVMNIYGGNDLRGAAAFFDYRQRLASEAGREHLVASCVGLPRPACVVYRTLKEGPLGRSYAFNLVSNASREGLIRIRLAFKPDERPDEPSFRYRVRVGDEDVLFNRGNADLDDLEYARRLDAGEISLALFDEALKTFVALGREHGFRPVVSFTPAAYAAYQQTAQFEDPAAGELIQRFSDVERAYLARRAREIGYQFVDFTPALRAGAQRGEFLFFPSNVHLAKAGHAVVAAALASAIR